MKRLAFAIVGMIVIMLYACFGLTSNYAIEKPIKEEYTLQPNSLKVSSSTETAPKTMHQVTRVFEINRDGTWGEIDLNVYYQIIGDYQNNVYESGMHILASGEALSAAYRIPKDNKSQGRLGSPITRASKYVSQNNQEQLALSFFEYRRFVPIKASFAFKNEIVFEVNQERTLQCFFKPFMSVKRIKGEVFMLSPIQSENGVIGYIEVRSDI